MNRTYTHAAKLTSMLILVLGYSVVSAQSIDHWESIIQTGDACTYYIPDQDIGSAWRNIEFDDQQWIAATGGIGYGDDDDNTTIASGVSSVYMRYVFQINNLDDIASILLDVDYDDGFIAFLNGTEIARANVPEPSSWNMELPTDHEARMYSGGRPSRFFTNTPETLALLNPGENLLAIEIHNHNTQSSDLSSNVFLHAGIKSANTYFSSVPTWFTEPVSFDDFNLPLLMINTNGQSIPDEPRIVADMGIIHNGPGVVNKPTDPWNEYNGKISIERRGASSMGFEKKSYSIELQNPDGSNNNVSVFGFPEENDFVLYGPYSDKTLMKNVISYHMYREMGDWAPRTHYVELFLNDEYRGIYVFTEKHKRDENRVDIDKLTPADITEPAITGGYMLRRDKKNGLPPETYWTSPVNQPYYEQLWYEYFDPDYYELVPEQRQYIRAFMKEFDEMMSGPNFKDPVIGYRSYIDEESFIHYLFLNEISKGIDNYMFSTYFYKQNDEDGGKFFAGPPWDYNLGYGNLDYGLNNNIPYTHSWVYNNWSRVYWWRRLLEDDWFKNEVYCRWDDLRSNELSDESYNNLIDSLTTYLGDAVERNFAKFPILGTYVWPNSYYPDTYEEEIAFLKSWTLERLAWMDSQWAGKCIPTTANPLPALNKPDFHIQVLPNPSDFSRLTLNLEVSSSLSETTVALYSLNGMEIDRIPYKIYPGTNRYALPDYSHLPSGMYVLRIQVGSQMHYEKLIKD